MIEHITLFLAQCEYLIICVYVCMCACTTAHGWEPGQRMGAVSLSLPYGPGAQTPGPAASTLQDELSCWSKFILLYPCKKRILFLKRET